MSEDSKGKSLLGHRTHRTWCMLKTHLKMSPDPKEVGKYYAGDMSVFVVIGQLTGRHRSSFTALEDPLWTHFLGVEHFASKSVILFSGICFVILTTSK